MKNWSLIIMLLLLINCTAFSQSNKYAKLEFSHGDVDTFTINKTKFRILIIDSNSNRLTLEKYAGGWGGWMLIDTFNTSSSHYTRSYDINHDGFNDIGIIDNNICEAYLFNPFENTFIKSGIYSPSEFGFIVYVYNETIIPMQLIDKELNIYFDFAPSKRSQWTSNLFQIKNYKRIELGKMSTKVKSGDWNLIESVSIEKSNEDYSIVRRVSENEKFDYTAYWKKNWRKFLPK